jgi:tetratricopeptide (TPR) repeat protein
MNVNANVIRGAQRCNAAGRYADALALIHRASQDAPNDPLLQSEEGSTLYEWGRYREARVAFRRGAALDPNQPGLALKLGWVNVACGYDEEAADWFRRAVEVSPDLLEPRFALAVALRSCGQVDEAIRTLESVIAREPDHEPALSQLGRCLLDRGDSKRAEEIFRRALATGAVRRGPWSGLGAALMSQDRYPEGIAAFENAMAVEDSANDDGDAFVNLALAYAEDGRAAEALAVFERYLPERPSPRAGLAYAGALLRSGRLREGWRQYEYRWLEEPLRSSRACDGVPEWNGQDLRGRTVMLDPEQGTGDSIQFVRYASLLKSSGANVYLRAKSELAYLLRTSNGVDRVFAVEEPLPVFDFRIPLMSLPRVFGTNLDSIPAEVPYLRADPERKARWSARVRVDGRLNVGLVWAGNPGHVRDRFRSIPLSLLSPLSSIDCVRFVSLQKGTAAEEATKTSFGVSMLDLAPELFDFSDTAALIDALDLVIAVDTAVLHLAGALGKPVWALLPAPSDFRWVENRDDSPWYPTMRLFRQTKRDDWNEVVARVATALAEWTADSATLNRATGESCLANPQQNRAPDHCAADVAPGHFVVAQTRLCPLQIRPHDEPTGKALDWYGEYLQPQLDLLAQILRAGGTVVEVGAGIGAHSVVLASLVGPISHLIVYEEDPVLRRVLNQNLAAAGAANVTIMRRSLTIETLDGLRLADLQMLKVNDVNVGLDVLKGGSATLWQLRPKLFMAARDEPALAELSDCVQEFGYRRWKVATPLFNSNNFNRRKNDIFAGRTVLALLAIPEEIEIANAFPGHVELR